MSSFPFNFAGLEGPLHNAYPEFCGRLSKKASDFTRNYGVMSMVLGVSSTLWIKKYGTISVDNFQYIV